MIDANNSHKVVIVGNNSKIKIGGYYYIFKIAAGVGKSSIIQRFCQNAFSNETQSTVGFDYCTAVQKVDNRKAINFSIWDTVLFILLIQRRVKKSILH